MAVKMVKVKITLVNSAGCELDSKTVDFEESPDGFGDALNEAVWAATEVWSFAIGDTITIREVE